MPGQRWGRACFADYRRQERAREQEAREKYESPGNLVPEAARSAVEGQNRGKAGVPSLTVRVRLGHVLRFEDGRLYPEDAETLKRLPAGVHDALVWVAWGGRRP